MPSILAGLEFDAVVEPLVATAAEVLVDPVLPFGEQLAGLVLPVLGTVTLVEKCDGALTSTHAWFGVIVDR